MSDSKETVVHGLIAEYDSVDGLKAAATRVRDAGYQKTDAFAPFPVHGLDHCLGIKPTVLPWISLTCGVIGCFTGLAMQIWMNGIDYMYIISGKPFISLPAFIPVSYELTILLASFGAFFGMLALNKLPRFSNPVFTNPNFDRATDDRFFLMIEASDPRYQEAGVRALLADTAPLDITEVREDESPTMIPRWILTSVGVLVLLAMVPPLLGMLMRVTKSDSPRFHVFFDMDFQPKKLSQQTSTLFADGRVMRPPVPGTVARGEFSEDESLDFFTGIDMEKLAMLDAPRANRLVAALFQQESGDEVKEGDGDKPAEDKPADPKPSDEKPAATQDEGSKPKEAPEAKDEPKSAEKPAADKPADAAPKSDADSSKEKDSDKPAEPKKDATAKEDVPATAKEEKPVDAKKMETLPANSESAIAPPPPVKEPAATSPSDAPAAATDQPVDNTPYLNSIPAKVTDEFVLRGKERFEIYCAVCHGVDGAGNGLVAERARALLSPTWTPPSSLHQEPLYQQPDGKIFSTITNGIRKMPGYSGQISTRDRWAIVAYVRALQRSRNAQTANVSPDSL